MAGRKVKSASARKPRSGSQAKITVKAGGKGKPAAKKVSAKVKTSAKATVKPKAGVKPKALAKKTSAKKAPIKKAVAKKAVAKKAVSKKTAVKKAAPKKVAPKKTAGKKTAPKARTKAHAKARVKTSSKSRATAIDTVVSVARTLKKVRVPAASPADAKIIQELGDLAKYIRAAKREIAAIRPDNVKDEHLPKAADELDAVVAATADATNTIMDACEVVEGVMGSVTPDVSNTLMDATTRIYEACTFQDITGQRIGKVVTTMKHIEGCIDALIMTFGSKKARSQSKAQTKAAGNNKGTDATAADPKKITDADLLNGPQLAKNAKSQAEIDDLFSSFD